MHPASDHALRSTLYALRSTPDAQRDRPVGVYTHIPFCRIKCPYCDFNAYAGKRALYEPYAAALPIEAAAWAAESAVPLSGRTLYFGGGTPSLFTPEQIAGLIAGIDRAIPLQPELEITLEANPGTITRDHLRALRATGVNRLSLGIQSFQPRHLKWLGRGHDVAACYAAYEDARAAGFENVSCDLMYGLPEQSLEDVRADVDILIRLGPEHVSLYPLQVEEGTPVARWVAAGRAVPAGEDAVADAYELIAERLTGAGYVQYEIASWAKPGWHSRHNRIYWENDEYVALGAGGHGYFGGERSWNVDPPAEYVRLVRETGRARAGADRIGPDLERSETVILGLRLAEGLTYDRYQRRFGEDLRDRFGATLRDVAGLGLLSIEPERIRLTPRGQLLGNEVFWRFLPDTSEGGISTMEDTEVHGGL